MGCTRPRAPLLLTCCLILATVPALAAEPEQQPDPAGPSTFGQRGFHRTWAAQPFDTGSYVIGSSLEYFTAKDFLATDDDNERMTTRFIMAGSPIEGLELNLGFSLVVNHNPGFEPVQTQSVGDPFFGVRYGITLADWFALGGGVQAILPSGKDFSELSAEGISTRILFAFDFVPIPEMLITLNAGYHFDNSGRIFDYPLNPAQRFAAGIIPHDQVLTSLGVTYQVGPVAPFVEYGLAALMGADDAGFTDSPSWITIGLRAWPFPLHNLHLMAAADIGLTGVSGVPEGEAQIPRWNLIVAAGFNFGELPEPVKVIEEKIVEKPVEVRVEVPCKETSPVAAKPVGRIAGTVVDINTKKPLGNARVVVSGKESGIYMTDPETGTFLSCSSEPGPAKLTVSLEDFREETQAVLISEAPRTPVTIELTPARGKTFGKLKGTIQAASGKPLAALVSIPARKIRKRANKTTGQFEHKLATGVFDVLISMPGYVTQRRKIKLRPGDLVILNVELEARK